MFALEISAKEIYDKCYERGYQFATRYKGHFDYIELDNELDNRAIKQGEGRLPGDYKDDEYNRVMNSLKGLADGVRAADPNVKRLIGTAGWYHYEFLDRLLADGVTFEVISWHWYSNNGSMSRVMSKLSSYGKPIWVTEMNLRDSRRNTKMAEQAEMVALYANEMSRMPHVEAVFVYELLDGQSKVTTEKPDDPEPYFGLHTITKDAAKGQWKLGEKKPAFFAYQERIRALGDDCSLGDILVDDAYQYPAVTFMGNDGPRAWQSAQNQQAFSRDYIHTTAHTVSSAIRFHPFIPVTGKYEVSMWFLSSPAHHPAVPIKVQHADGVSALVIDQREGGRWIALGTYNFQQGEPGDASYVEVAGNNRNGQVIADAVKFHRLP